MKLWKKYMIGMLLVVAILGTGVSSLYIYSKDKSIIGYKHHSMEPTEIKLNEISDIKKYKISFRDPVNSKKIVGNFKINIKKNKNKFILKEGKINNKPAREWIENYYKKNNQPPVMFLYAANGIKFINFYSEIIRPNDFIRLVYWISQNIPWTPEIATLSSFKIKRGIEKDRNRVNLGKFTNENGEKKEINLMPDSFYGMINFAKYITKLNIEPLTKTEVKKIINEINKKNKKEKDANKKILPYSIQKIGVEKYDIYISNIGFSLIENAKKLYSYKKIVSDIDLSLDENGLINLHNRNSKKIHNSERISRLSLVKAFSSKQKWKGISINFLKNMIAHEMGHLITLSMVENSANNPVAIKPSNNSIPNAAIVGGQINIDVLNKYFDARIPFIKAKRVSPLLYLDPKTKKYRYRTYEEAVDEAIRKNKKIPSKDNFMNIAFEIDRTPQNNNDVNTMLNIDRIFAGNLDPTNPYNMLYSTYRYDPNFQEELKIIINQIKNAVLNGENKFQFLMRDIKDTEAFAKFLGVPTAAVMFINANDNYVPTISHEFNSLHDGVPFGKKLDINYKWISDSIFTIKSKNNKVPWFITEIPKELPSGITKKDIMNMSIESYTTKIKYYINPFAALANGAPATSLKKYMMEFGNWFYNNIYFYSIGVSFNKMRHDTYFISGNYSMFYPSFNPLSIEKSTMFLNSGIKLEGKQNENDIIEIYKQLNNIKNIETTKFVSWNEKQKWKHIIYNYNLKNGMDIINKYNIWKEKNFSHIYLSPIISVINKRRIVSGTSTTFNNWLRTKKIFEPLQRFFPNQSRNNRMGEYTEIAKQKIFKIFQNDDKYMPLLMFAKNDDEEPLVSKLSWKETNLTKWENELKRVAEPEKYKQYIEKINKMHNKFKIFWFRFFVSKSLILKANFLKFNNNFENNHRWNRFSNFDTSKLRKQYNFKNIKFKIFPFEKLIDLMYININNAVSGRIEKNRRIYLSINDNKLKNYIDNIEELTKNEKDNFRNMHYINLVDGFEDFELEPNNASNFRKLFTLFENMGPIGLKEPILRSIAGNFINRVLNKENNKIDDKKFDLEYFNLQNLEKKNLSKSSSDKYIKTLAAMQFILSGHSYILDSANSWADWTKIKIIEYPEIKKWIHNLWSGWKSELSSIFADYTFLFEETLTRDFMQISYVPNFAHDDPNNFRYQPKYTNISEGILGFELYFEPQIFLNKNSRIYKFIKNRKIFNDWTQSLFNFLQEIKNKNVSWKRKIGNLNKNDITKWSNNIHQKITSDFNSIARNMDYYKDRWLRDMLKDEVSGNGIKTWKIYDNSGNPIIDPNIKITRPIIDKKTNRITFRKLHGKEKNRANAFWWWMLTSYGVGNRTITGIWRDKSRDSMTMWGYLPIHLSEKIKYIKATKGNQVKYIPIYTKNTNNLFYLKKQGDISSKFTLKQEGFASWNTNFFSAGTWTNSLLSSGEWILEFVDKDKKSVIDPNTKKNAFTLGDKKNPGALSLITENNKDKSYAPIRIENKDGKTILIIKNQFIV